MENELVVNRKDRVVIYNPKKKVYEKYIYPKFSQRIKILLGLKRAPGKNVFLLSKLFKKNNIKTYEVLEFKKYYYLTKEVAGETLLEAIIKNKANKPS